MVEITDNNFELNIEWLSNSSFKIKPNDKKFIESSDISFLIKYKHLTEEFLSKYRSEINNPIKLIEYIKNNPYIIFRSCESPYCILNCYSTFRILCYTIYPIILGLKSNLQKYDNLCVTILFGGYYHSEINFLLNLLTFSGYKNITIRLVGDSYIEEIIERNKNKNIFKFDETDTLLKRALCFLNVYIRWTMFYEILSTINNNITLEIHKTIDTLDIKKDYYHYNFSFDNIDDFYNGMIECKKLLKNYDNNLFVGKNYDGDIDIIYNKYIINNFYRKLDRIGINILCLITFLSTLFILFCLENYIINVA